MSIFPPKEVPKFGVPLTCFKDIMKVYLQCSLDPVFRLLNSWPLTKRPDVFSGVELEVVLCKTESRVVELMSFLPCYPNFGPRVLYCPGSFPLQVSFPKSFLSPYYPPLR